MDLELFGNELFDINTPPVLDVDGENESETVDGAPKKNHKKTYSTKAKSGNRME